MPRPKAKPARAGSSRSTRTISSRPPHRRRKQGVLRPTILIGIGSFGRRALQEIRCRLTDRVGDVVQVPCFRFLYVDCDPDAVAKAISAPPDVALSLGRSVPRAAPAGHPVPPPPTRPDPRLAAAREALLDPAEPARGRVAGLRAARVLRQLPAVRDPAAARTADRHAPRVDHAVVRPDRADAARQHARRCTSSPAPPAGSGGMLLDLGYAVRRVLARMTTAEPPVTAFVYASAPTDPGTGDHELANLYAGTDRTEPLRRPGRDVHRALRRAGGAEGRGHAGCRSPRRTSADAGADLGRVPRLRLAPGRVRRPRPDDPARAGARTDSASGRRDSAAARSGRSAPTACGIPRGLLLRAAAQRICLRLLRVWREDAPPADMTAVDALVDAGNDRYAAAARLRAAADRARGRPRSGRRAGRPDRALADRAGGATRIRAGAARRPGRGRAASGSRPAISSAIAPAASWKQPSGAAG